MNWKDWLYIPKTDKIAIVILIILIYMLLGVHLTLNYFDKQKALSNNSVIVSEDYEKWKAQLYTQKEEEKQNYFNEQKQYSTSYQPKIKEEKTIELNSADTTQLKTIPGIGSGYANRIVNYRNALGGFTSIEQLGEVTGMDTYLYSQITPYFTLDSKYDSLYINQDSFDNLLRHPYLSYKQVLVIIDIRTRKGTIKSLKRLELLDEFTRRDIERLAIYANFK